jgi:predicted DNA-binding ArsR family transcriptional regulator
MSKNFRDLSRDGWIGKGTMENINAGSLQRIADATETIAKSYDQMRENRDYWKKRCEDEMACSKRLAASNRALRGVIKRVKNRTT